MARTRLPHTGITRQHPLNKRIALILEGNEDSEYIKRLISIGVLNPSLYIELFVAHGNSRLFERFLKIPDNKRFDLYLFLCDTEYPPYNGIKQLKNDIDDYYHINGVSDKIVFFSNPMIMNVIAYHYKDKFTIPTTKKDMSGLFYDNVFGIKHYEANKTQISKIMNGITIDNYQKAKERLKSHQTDKIEQQNGTNILTLFSYLESDDTSWVDELSKQVNEKLKKTK